MTSIQENNGTAKKVAEAYVDPETVVLDPEKLDQSILDRMPQPTGSVSYTHLTLPTKA